MPTLTTPIQHSFGVVLEVVATAIRAEKEVVLLFLITTCVQLILL